jgi:hypothetical protein
MGTKPSNNFQSDRPESGGADRKGEREDNGLLELEKQRLASERAREKEQDKPGNPAMKKADPDSGES